ncbi:MAG: TIM barrel protein [Granulosicoccus sp.]
MRITSKQAHHCLQNADLCSKLVSLQPVARWILLPFRVSLLMNKGNPLPSFSVNHMTMAKASYQELLDVASGLDCVGVELRTDLEGDLFDGSTANAAAESAQSQGLRILALSEVSAFNHVTEQKLTEAESLMKTAHACGAEAISLIPRNDAQYTDYTVRKQHLREALIALEPLLRSYNLIGLIEPLGFDTSSLRYKCDIVDIIDSLGAKESFKLVHDTFHHHLSGEWEFYPAHTGIVHVSGVCDSSLSVQEMQDSHRMLVDETDCLDNIGQINSLLDGGYSGPFSFEAFSPRVHAFTDPKAELFGSINHITSSLANGMI